ncbi:hypothetical protein LTR10_015780 [Elasticomyces elasticus]|uniref:Choline kinase N-terminal domain-containing protein n=1 Tax=Exophiala sideris TaxID=1016849 RepID=A0ABR0IYB4_9EURO|nr:hypothetical protein LTR10_015780 [Elasticomyces elasticus]KAK5022548.1 hypothetical protein LTS07_009994 [Exophiala sideris]KAK5028076.1 hypothetical protein LTR13_009305 [Exophiala sideris]KAK5051817.1 hypothetical protein LTR69_010108 [Exophiala sideris]KAK5177851.1 hypothetical protein LTR44_009616 [Eurotiomycetes sp. CCFEE 6388]
MASYSSSLSPTTTRDAQTPRTGAQKGVTIFDEPETIEPVRLDDYDAGPSPNLVGSQSPRLHRASMSGKKLTGRPAFNRGGSSASVLQPMSYLSLDRTDSEAAGTPTESKTPADLRTVLSQVVDWFQEEKERRRKHRHHRRYLHPLHHRTPSQPTEDKSDDVPDDNDADLALDKLEQILSGFASLSLASLPKLSHKSSSSLARKGSIAKKFKRGSIVPASSDTEFFGDDVLVPNVEAHLDNSKTMAFTGGSADTEDTDNAKKKDYDHWVRFKQEIVRLTHTLKIKGWRRIPIDRAQDIEVVRLSGALTNAVYVVRPPQNMSEYDNPAPTPSDSSMAPTPVPKRRPIQLLLRIYGPQVEHLIDRDSELLILRRLARKKIGPRLLGSFENGRFEEFLHARTLTAEDLRVPETSKQIAKRMRELHEGIELLESELEAGPAVFLNWDKWVDRVEKVIMWLDNQVHMAEAEANAGTARRGSVVNPRYIRRGLICGVEWPVFRKTYEAYRKRLISDSGGMKKIRDSLVFAHNDTQYGNLMRLEPSGTSPLLQPANHHKQLVVIDFEYASQNMVGMEFANHFTEWCYNYHHSELSYACDTRRYPNENEQHRFVRAYVMHRPQFAAAASATPKMEGREKTNISDFMLDARAPPPGSGTVAEMDYDNEEKEREKAQEEDIQRLLHETRVWRAMNSAQWVAWGIVQAKVPELDALEKKKSMKGRAGAAVDKAKEMAGAARDFYTQQRELYSKHLHPLSDPMNEEDKRLKEESEQDRPEGRIQEEAHHEGDGEVFEFDGEDEEPHEDEFDYLAYAQDRAMFFWGDCVQMGLVKLEELPEDLRSRIRIVPY